MPTTTQIIDPDDERGVRRLPSVDIRNTQEALSPNGKLGFDPKGFLGGLAQFGAVGLMAITLWTMQRDSTTQNRQAHTDLMGLIRDDSQRKSEEIGKAIDRIDRNQGDIQRRADKQDEKFEKVFEEVKTGRKEHTDLLNRMLSKMPDK